MQQSAHWCVWLRELHLNLHLLSVYRAASSMAASTCHVCAQISAGMVSRLIKVGVHERCLALDSDFHCQHIVNWL